MEKIAATQKAYHRLPDAMSAQIIWQRHQRGRASGQKHEECRAPDYSDHHGPIPEGSVNKTLRAPKWFRYSMN
jgi:hypothetical protein